MDETTGSGAQEPVGIEVYASGLEKFISDLEAGSSSISKLNSKISELGSNNSMEQLAKQLSNLGEIMQNGLGDMAEAMNRFKNIRIAAATSAGNAEVAALELSSQQMQAIIEKRDLWTAIASGKEEADIIAGLERQVAATQDAADKIWAGQEALFAKREALMQAADLEIYESAGKLAAAYEQSYQTALVMDDVFNAKREANAIKAQAIINEAHAGWVASYEKDYQTALALDDVFNAKREMNAVKAQAIIDEAHAGWVASYEKDYQTALALDDAFNSKREMNAIKAQAIINEAHAGWVASYEKDYQTALAMDDVFNARRIAASQEALRYVTELDASELAKQLAAESKHVEALEKLRAADLADRAKAIGAELDLVEKQNQDILKMRADAYARNEALAAAALANTKAEADASVAAEAKRLKEIEALRAGAGGASGTTALIAQQRALAPAIQEVSAAQTLENAVLNEAQGMFRGAAHEAGIYGLMHGQLVALLAGGAIAAALHKIATEGAEVEYSLQFLKSLGSDMAPVDLDKFVGIASGTLSNLKEAGEGMRALAEAGFSQQEAMNGLTPILRLASLGEMSVAESAKMAVESMHAFGLGKRDLEIIGDTLVSVASKANVSVKTLSEDMATFSTTAKMLNISMQEAAATVGVMAEKGLPMRSLATALSGLYEPSKKTQEILDKLQVSTSGLSEGTKTYTQFVGELVDALAKQKDRAAEINALAKSTASDKAIETISTREGFAELLRLTEAAQNAAGKMFQATIQQSDTVEGSFKQLASTVDGAFVKSFASASPVIREVENSLKHIAESKDFQDTLETFARTVSKLTQIIVDHIGVIEGLVAAYAGMRILQVVAVWAESLAAAQAVEAGATIAATAAMKIKDSVYLGSLVSTQAVTAAVGTLAAEEVVATEATIAWTTATKLAEAFMGPLGWAVLAAGALYVAYSEAIDKSDDSLKKMNNTTETTIDALKREYDRVHDLNEQYRLAGELGPMAAQKVATSIAHQATVSAQAALAQNKAQIAFIDNQAQVGDAVDAVSRSIADDDRATLVRQQKKIENDLVIAQNSEITLKTTQEKTNKENDLYAAISKTLQVQKDAAALPELAKDITGPDAARLKESASSMADLVSQMAKRNAENSEYAKLQSGELELTRQIMAAKRSTDTHTDTKAATDAFSAYQTMMQGEITLVKDVEKEKEATIAASVKRGTMGEIQGANEVYEAKRASILAIVSLIQMQEEAAVSGANKVNMITKLENEKNVLAQADLTAQTVLQDKLSDRAVSAQKIISDLEAKTAADQGQHEAAALAAFDAARAPELVRATQNVAFLTQQNDLTEKGVFQLAEEVKVTEDLAKARAAAAAAGHFQDVQGEATKAIGAIKLASEDLKLSLTGGLEDYFKAGDFADKVKATLIPSIDSAIQALQALNKEQLKSGGSNASVDALIKQLEAAKAAALSTQGAMSTLFTTIGAKVSSVSPQLAHFGAAFTGIGTAMHTMQAAQVSSNATMSTSLDVMTASSIAMSGLTEGSDEYTAAKDINTQATIANIQAQNENFSAQMTGYANMVTAAQGFFKQGSDGYKTMQDVAITFHALDLALSVSNFVTKMALNETYTAEDIVLKAASATAAGITAIANSLCIPPPLSFVAAGITAGILVGAGVKGIKGGGSPTLAEQQQSGQSGTVLGDPLQQSDSINASLKAITSNTGGMLTQSGSLLTAFNNLTTTMANMTNVILTTVGVGVTGGVNAPVSLTSTDSVANSLNKLLNTIPGIAGSLPGDFAAKVTGVISNALFGGKQTLSGQGIQFANTTVAQAQQGQEASSSYANISTSGGLFRGSSSSTQVDSLGAAANQQFSLALSQIATGVQAAAGLLGVSGTQFTQNLEAYGFSLGQISTKGLTAAQVQTALSAAFSKASDQLVTTLIPGITQFAQAGEGATQTLVRVATDFNSVEASLKSIGMTVGTITAGSNTLNIASIQATENLITLAGSLSNFTSQAAYFQSTFLNEAQQSAPLISDLSDKMNALGEGAVTTEAQFTQLVQAQDLNTTAGQNMYNSLMQIAPEFAQVAQYQADAAAGTLKLTALQTAAQTTLTNAYNAQYTALSGVVSNMTAFAASTDQLITTLSTGSLTVLTPMQQYAATKAAYQTDISQLSSTDPTVQANAQSQLQTVATAFLTASQTVNASSAAYQQDYATVQANLALVSASSKAQATIASTQLTALNAQVAGLVTLNTTALTIAQSTQAVNLAIAGMAASLGVSIANLTAALKPLGSAPTAAQTDAQTAATLAAMQQQTAAFVNAVQTGGTNVAANTQRLPLS